MWVIARAPWHAQSAVDDITNLCDAGAFTVSRCKRKLAYLDGNGHLLKDET